MPKIIKEFAQKLRARRTRLKIAGLRKKKLPKPPTPRFPRAMVIEYKRTLLDMVSGFLGVVEQDLLPNLELLVPAQATTTDSKAAIRTDADSRVERIFAGLKVKFGKVRKRISKSALEKTASALGEFNLKEINKAFTKVLGIDITRIAPSGGAQIETFVAENIALIKSIDETLLSELHAVVTEAVKQGSTADTLKNQILERFGVAESRASLIARDQIGKLNGQLTEARQTALGVEKYRWSSSSDERVRPMHADLDGDEFTWDDPPVTNEEGDRNHPGEDYQCRCAAIPIMEDLANLPDLVFSSEEPVGGV